MSVKQTEQSNPGSALENILEKILWGFRHIIILGVVGLMLGSIIMFLLGIFETFTIIKIFFSNIYNHGIHFSELIYNDILIQIIVTVDDFLLGMVFLIFGLGSYDLFISEIDVARKVQHIRRPDWLRFESIDELKNILAKVVLMILVINFLKLFLGMKFNTPLDLVYLAVGILLIALSIKFSHGQDIEKTRIVKK